MYRVIGADGIRKGMVTDVVKDAFLRKTQPEDPHPK